MIGWVALAGALAALPALFEARRAPLTGQGRAPGALAPLSDGVTHHEWLGPKDGAVAVCVHGLTTPSFVWWALARRLSEAGYRVLVYDLYGRGYSAAPRGRQTPQFFCRQLSDLLDHEGVTKDFTLLGYSMGGVISATWAAENPQRVRRLILLAPAGMRLNMGGVAKLCVAMPLLGDWLFHMVYPGLFRRGVVAERHLDCSVPNITEQQLAQLGRRGFIRAVLSSLRGTLRHPIENTHRHLAKASVPVTAIWGRDDHVIPLRAMGHLTQMNQDAEQIVIGGGGHGLPYTHTDTVARAITGSP